MTPHPPLRSVATLLWLSTSLATGCGDEAAAGLSFVAVTFNTGTNPGVLRGIADDNGGYMEAQAAISDEYYGDGLAWSPAIADVRSFFAVLGADVVGFQEVFDPHECAAIPAGARAGFVCETYRDGDPVVAQQAVGEAYQVACHLEHSDKCIAVARRFGTIRGCASDYCPNALAGAEIEGCGGGSRVGRAVIDLVAGGELTVVNLHGTSGLTTADSDCRSAQFRQVFVDLGTGDGPAANGARNVVLGDLNTDPVRLEGRETSANTFATYVGPGKPFHFATSPDDAETSPFRIDRVASDTFDGDCVAYGATEGYPPVTTIEYFDHQPFVCRMRER